MLVRVHGSAKNRNKRVMRVGDAVTIRAMPGDTPRSRVNRAKRPVIAAIRHANSSKLATVRYTDTADNRQHLVELGARALEAGQTNGLAIGDHVVVKTRGGCVLPAVGSEGTVLAGSETTNLYTVTFQMTHNPDDGAVLGKTVTVTQDGVPRSALTFTAGESDDEVKGGSDADDSDDDSDDQLEGGETDDKMLNPSPSLLTLRQKLSGSVREQVMQVLSLDELEELAIRLGETSVDGKSLTAVLKLISASE